MKPVSKTLSLFILIIFVLSVSNAFGQQKPAAPKVKTVVVWEEKFNNLVNKKVKESETTYDITGNILEDIQYVDGKVDKHFQYQYDAAGNKIKEIEFEPTGKVKETSQYKIENGLRVEKITYDAQGRMKLRKTYIYTTF